MLSCLTDALLMGIHLAAQATERFQPEVADVDHHLPAVAAIGRAMDDPPVDRPVDVLRQGRPVQLQAFGQFAHRAALFV